MKSENALPAKLTHRAGDIHSTERAFVRIRTLEEAAPSLKSSHLGGIPYWPLNDPYPMYEEESPYHLLIQINFAEVPAIAPFPLDGILQIFLADTPLHGVDLEHPQIQNGFRIVFHPEIEEKEENLIQDFSFLPEPVSFPMPLEASFSVQFEAALGIAPPDSRAFTEKLGEGFFDQFGDEKWQVLAEYRRFVTATGHKIGGYPHFPQEDPRPEGEFPILLLQLDSDVNTGLNWGDRGTAHFFIEALDLLERDFSKVFYSWSSY